MARQSGRVAAQTGSREQSPDGLGPTGFDPSRVKVLTARDAIKDALQQFNRAYGGTPHGEAHWKPGYTRGMISDALAKLDPETCTASEIRDIIGVSSWATLDCDVCGRDVPMLARIGDDPDYEMRWQDICLECIAAIAQTIETRSAKTKGLGPKDESVVRDSECAHDSQPHHGSGGK